MLMPLIELGLGGNYEEVMFWHRGIKFLVMPFDAFSSLCSKLL